MCFRRARESTREWEHVGCGRQKISLRQHFRRLAWRGPEACENPGSCLEAGKRPGQLGKLAFCSVWAMPIPASDQVPAAELFGLHAVHTHASSSNDSSQLQKPTSVRLRPPPNNHQHWTVSISLVNPGLRVGRPIWSELVWGTCLIRQDYVLQ